MKNEAERILTGKNIVLRPPQTEDFYDFVSLARRNRRFHQNLVTPPRDEQGFNALLGRNLLETDEVFLICRRSDGAIVGGIALSQIFLGKFHNAYLGYFLGEEFTGAGLMTEALQLVLRFAFKTLKLHRVEANVQPENLQSIAVLRRCGFRKEGFSEKYLKIGGRWRDHERWAIIVENRRKKNVSIGKKEKTDDR